MNVLQTVLIFVGAPLGLFLLVALLAAGRRRSRRTRYRPGDAWRHEPVWWTANPEGAALARPAGPPVGAESPAGAAKGGADGVW